MSVYDIFDAVFFISLAGIVVGLLSLVIKVCLKSKCEHFTCCYGCFTIDRRVDLEVQEEIHRMDVGAPDDLEMQSVQPQQPSAVSTKTSTKTKRPSFDIKNDKLESV